MNWTPGKLRGLQSTSTAAGVFCILAFDHRGSLRKMLKASQAGDVTYDQIVGFKTSVVKHLAPSASGVLVDPLYGAAQVITAGALPGSVGLLVALEATGYTGDKTARQTALLPDWSVAAIKQMGASAVKLLVYYHPDAGELAQRQEALVAQIANECRAQDIAFFLEPVSYSLKEDVSKDSAAYAADRPRVIRDIAARLGALKPDVLKLEFPVDAHYESDEGVWRAACRAVSDASPVPWTLLSAGVDFPVFRQQVLIACQEGASGYLAGRAVWQEAVELSGQARDAFLQAEASQRLAELQQIANREARPWTDFYSPQSVPEDWYSTYGAGVSKAEQEG